ncbi:MAG: hypothetical protein H0A75_03370 [Candidatus Methanofishera endochildressiae]|uniref:Uncharacterized protein n=1 Tax=Candidatus Methanofishera endochildressiae TaxID=2738884 RepID=A0A7Z0SDI5_9GAMM|nr:hypothetical protein [Candidatus Methanofishera endochildressiae]
MSTADSIYATQARSIHDITSDNYAELTIIAESVGISWQAVAGSRYFCESLFWASQPKQAAKT